MDRKVKNHGPQGWSLDCGAYLNPQGKRMYRRHWLGQDKKKAETVGKVISAEWSVIEAHGGTVWTPDALQKIDGYKRAMKYLGQGPENGESVARIDGPATGGTLYAAIDDYLKSVEVEKTSDQICSAHAKFQSYAMDWLRHAMTDKPLADMLHC